MYNAKYYVGNTKTARKNLRIIKISRQKFKKRKKAAS